MHSILNLSKLLYFLSFEWLNLHAQALLFSVVCAHKKKKTAEKKISDMIHTSELKLFHSAVYTVIF